MPSMVLLQARHNGIKHAPRSIVPHTHGRRGGAAEVALFRFIFLALGPLSPHHQTRRYVGRTSRPPVGVPSFSCPETTLADNGPKDEMRLLLLSESACRPSFERVRAGICSGRIMLPLESVLERGKKGENGGPDWRRGKRGNFVGQVLAPRGGCEMKGENGGGGGAGSPENAPSLSFCGQRSP